MRNTKLWSVLLVSVLLCACVLGVLFTGASAVDVAKTYTVNTANTENDEASLSFKSIADALSFAAEQEWKTNETLVIKFTGTEAAKVGTSELAFGQKTIWRRVDAETGAAVYGNKLPIEIVGQSGSDADTISVTAKIACANDYTFKDLTLNNWTNKVAIYAGSGQITLNSLKSTGDSNTGGKMYADSYTAEAFEGWYAEDFNALKDEDDCILTALTFKSTTYYAVSSNSTATGVGAVGTAYADSYSYTAPSANGGESVVITPEKTKAQLEVGSGANVQARLGGYVPKTPARVHTVIIKMTDGGKSKGACGDSGADIGTKITNGNIEIILDSPVFSSLGIRVLYGSSMVNTSDIKDNADGSVEYGNITLRAKNVTGYDGNSVFIDGSGNRVIPGKCIVDVDGWSGTTHTTDHTKSSTSHEFEYIGIGAKKGIETRLKGCLLQAYSGTRMTKSTAHTVSFPIKNELIDCQLATRYYVSSGKNSTAGNIFSAVSFRSDTPLNHKKDKLDENGDKVYGSDGKVVQVADPLTANVGDVTNIWRNVRSEWSYYGVGSVPFTKVGNVVNDIADSYIGGHAYGVGVTADVGTVTNIYDTVEFAADKDFYGTFGSSAVSPVSGAVENIFSDTVKVRDFYGTCYGTADSVTNTITGGEYRKFFGSYKTTVSANIENEIYSGTIPEFYGVCDYDAENDKALNHSVGSIKNTVYGGTIGHYDAYDGEYASYKGRVQTGDFKASNVSYSAPDTRTYFNGAYYATVKNNVENIIEGGTIHAYRGSYYGSAAKVINTVKNGGKSAPQIGPDLAQTAETAYYFGIYGTKATQVENNLMGGTIVYLRGTYHTNSDTYKIQKIYNLIDGAQIKRGYTGVHASVFKEVVTEVKSGNITSAFYPVYSQKKTVGDVVNIISGGAFSGGDVCLGGYGGKLINSVTTTISGDPTFANAVYFGGGSKVWPSRVGSITTEVTGGTFSNTVCGGGRSCYVTGDIDTKLLGGTFKKSVYGGNYEAFRSGSNNADTSFYGKSVDGTIKLTVGELGKAGPMFEHYLSGGEGGVSDNLTKEPVDVLVNFYSGTVTGNFYAGSEGQHSRLATVVSNVYGGTFNGKYFGGTYKSTITGNVTNHFHGGIFNGNVYGGGNNSSIEGTVLNNVYDGFVSNVTYYGGSSSGTVNIVKNVIRGGSFVGNGAIPGNPDSKPSYFDAYLGGEGKVTGGIINEISGGEFKYYTIAGTTGTVVSNSTEGAPAIKNIITGGTFHNFWGGNSKGNSISGDIVNEISGGLFDSFKDSKQTYPNCFNGGNRNGAHAGGNIINNVSGGVFKWNFTAGNNAHQLSMGLPGVEPAYAVTTNITGGIFEGHIYADYRPGTVGDGDFRFATATLNIAQTEGKELAIYATVNQCDSFAANGEAIKIGKKTAIVAENVSGTVSLNQTQGWLCKKYFTIVSGNGKFGEITTASGAFGNFATETYMEGEEGPAYVTRLYGASAVPVATSLILDKKLTVRVLFDPEEIAPYGTDFTFAAALGENALDTVFEEYTVDGVTYASYLIKGIGLGNFAEAIEISGAAIDTMTFSVVGLADTGAEYYENENATYAQLFKSIADLGRKENREDTKYDLVVSAVNWTPGDDQKPKALDERLSMKTIGLVMSDAIGIRLTGETAETLKFIVNGKDVTSNCVVTASEGTFTADMYVKVSMMTSPLNIVITDGEGAAMFTMTVRVDALAEQIAASTEEDAQLIDFALAYVQAADAYVKA